MSKKHEGCLINVFNKMRFPKLKKGFLVEINQPFYFDSLGISVEEIQRSLKRY
jgi:hypothetical protein